jgi:hypothetical protein
MPIYLHTPTNHLIARPILSHPPKPPCILNPISPQNIVLFNTQLLENHSTNIDTPITLLNNDTLMTSQWQDVCHSLDSLMLNITITIQSICFAPAIPPSSQRTNLQGGYLPQKL